MSKPLKERLPGSEPDAAALERVWQRVSERSERRSVTPLLAFAASAACVAIFFALRPGPCDEALCTTAGEPVQLALSGDASEAGRELSLADRSTLVLSPRTVALVTANTAAIVELAINTGKVSVHVEPNGPRRWGFTAGDVRVEVIGTRFSVERAASFVRVEVSEGVVQVSGPSVKDGVQQLRAGEVFDSSPPAPTQPASLPVARTKAPAVAKAPPRVVPAVEVQRPQATFEEPPRDTWRSLAGQGRFDEASVLLGKEGLAREATAATAAADLILLADIAAHRGDAGESERILALVASTAASNAEHAIAEYKRGLRFLERGAAQQSAECLERAIAFGLPQALAANAIDRVIEAWHLSGNEEKARTWRSRKTK